MATLFVSDLHLPAQPSPLREAFVRFLEGPALYILGDLFEVWIGDESGLQTYAREVSRLAALTARGVPVYFMHGNRDFLVGKRFAEITGVTLLDDPCVVDLHGTPTLLSHGDLFCTDDVGYQRWRRFSRNPLAQWVFLRLPLAWRQRIAGSAREQSAQDKATKTMAIMDVQPAAINAAFAQHQVRRMIHGHTHRPADHRLANGCERIVLADWTLQRLEVLSVDAQGLQRLPLDA